MANSSSTFEGRKQDHIRIALDPRTQAIGEAGLSQIELTHEALPDLNFDDVSIGTQSLGHHFKSPIFVSSMTAGHDGSYAINRNLAQACAQRGWLMGVGSQRKELTEGGQSAALEWQKIRAEFPQVQLAGNIGIAQVITSSYQAIEDLVGSIGAIALFVHTNPLQESLQPEGTPQFKGGVAALEKLCAKLSVPVILKEVGCGFSRQTLLRLGGLGIGAVDISGKGGTHWGRVEGYRSEEDSMSYRAAETFAHWGISTVDCLLDMQETQCDYELWASGGVRSGLDAAKLIALGAKMVGAAQPFLEGAIAGSAELLRRMEQFDYELKIALFVSGCATINELREKRVWRQVKI